MANPTSGQAMPYGTAIHDALDDPNSTDETLQALRDSARRILEQQGDLAGALDRLEAEISRRQA
jgi:Domain of unknown function (DUF1843)